MLDYDDDEGGDVLENVGLQDSFRNRVLQKRKNKLSRHVNSKLLPVNDDNDDVDEWEDPAGGQNLLTKYDDVDEMAQKKKRAQRLKIGDASG